MEPMVPSIPLPCMDKAARRTVHQLALQYGLNSKSVGSGHKRYTILSRKRSTELPETSRIIDVIIRQYNNQTRYIDPSIQVGKKGKRVKESRDWSNTPNQSTSSTKRECLLHLYRNYRFI
ncbi:hypothetical protein BDF19DRAFT_453243 [Syncephalis fuscata]|nr:hypothetical protein BDF19DRAFT_453243 [Syncephalis fuscata]